MLFNTNFNFPKQNAVYHGKVRDVYTIDNQYIVIVASDRISAFDHILPKPIPYKGQVLNQVAAHFLKETGDIVPNWLISTPHPNVSFGHKCDPIRLEMVVRGYLAGHAARTYKQGIRTLCGVALPEGLKENDKLPYPIITPSTKADEGHDEDISEAEILEKQIVSEETWNTLKDFSLKLFEKGTELAAAQGLILVDTKYEFGINHLGKIMLIDEVHTPDSSRYFYKEGYEERQAANQPQKQLSKEFVREWLIEHHFMGKEGQSMPEMPDSFVNEITDRYIELHNVITGHRFEKTNYDNLESEIEKAVIAEICTRPGLLDIFLT